MRYVQQLWEQPTILEYLRGRGLNDETIAEAQLGYVGVPERGHERMFHSIHIPYFDAAGRPRGAGRFRHLRSEMTRKYDQVHGDKVHMYGVELTTKPRVYLTEGEFDALILRQMGFHAVGIPGAKTFQRQWKWLFRDCDLVVVVMDPDEAGDKAKNKIMGQLSTVTDVREVDLPAGKDITDCFLADEAQLRSLL